jgi:murein DD-endopeptidase MepM/ murein hydrolase activator NlpD
MKKLNWNLVFADPSRTGGIRSVEIPGFLVVIFVVAAIVGVVGFGRVVYLGSNYALAVHDAAEHRRENDRLKVKIESLDRFVKQETGVITDLIAYEDNARLKYGMEAISSDVRKAGVGGFPSRDDILYSSMLDPLIVKAESLRLQVSSLNNQAELQESTFAQISKNVYKVYGNMARRPAIWPTNGRLSSTFGYRYHPFTGLRLLHEGLDIANSTWTPIYATADGQVQVVNNSTNFGNMVKVAHDNKGEYVTLYAHMQQAAVTQGQVVKRGDLIGYMGNTGRSTGTHLHYEVHRNGRPVDPMEFIVPVDQIVD